MPKKGRPPGTSPKGEASQEALFQAAISLFNSQGYERTTMRDIAALAGVSAGLLYRYYPSKAAVVMALYDRLSTEFATACEALPDGSWTDRTSHTLALSLTVLGPHRETLSAVLPVLLLDREQGLLSREAFASRDRVRACYVRAITEASNPPTEAPVLGRLAYMLQLSTLLFWLLDRTESQSGTTRLLSLLAHLGPLATAALWLPGIASTLHAFDVLVSESLYDDPS